MFYFVVRILMLFFRNVLFCFELSAEACNLTKKESPTQVFSCEFCETFKNTIFTKHLRATASDLIDKDLWWEIVTGAETVSNEASENQVFKKLFMKKC